MARFMTASRREEIEQAQKELATQVYKYQDFNGKCAVAKINSDVYKDASIIQFHSLARKYLATGVRDEKRASRVFYDTIDYLKSTCYAKLTPGLGQGVKPFNNKPRSKNKNSKKTLKTYTDTSLQINNKIESTNRIEIKASTLKAINDSKTRYGLQIEDRIRIFENESEINGYLKCIEDFNLTVQIKKLKLTLQEY